MPYSFRKEPSGKIALVKKATGKTVAHFKSMDEAKRAARVREYFANKGK